MEIFKAYDIRGRVPEEVFSEEFKPPATDGSGRNRSSEIATPTCEL